ncbi:MAG: ATP-binding protein [Candidatus Eremiobacteraeota bacterium]|nr:ATP-binding protein [Candidatus Eremiobacteraeota bacterium]
MIYPRDALSPVIPFLERKEFISISGPRQSGKTTLLKMIGAHLHGELKIDRRLITLITFEDRRLLAQFERDPVAFVQSYAPSGIDGILYLMIDEFQYARDGGQKLKLIFDTCENIKILITGSSSLDLKAQVGRFMVGRIVSFTLCPFNFGEYLSTKSERLETAYRGKSGQLWQWLEGRGAFPGERGLDIFHQELQPLYEDYCIWGGYPAVVLAGSPLERRKIFSEILNSFILKDIKTLLELATDRSLLRLSQYLAAQAGNIVVYRSLSEASNLDFRNVKKHLEILKETFVCREVRPFFTSRQRELSKNPKIYFLDNGFRNSLMEAMQGLEMRPDAGAIIENTVFIRLNQLHNGLGKINFWRTKAGAEVDFVLHLEGQLLPVEVKYSLFKSETIPRGLVSFIGSFRPRRAVVLTRSFWGIRKIDETETTFIPAYYL